MYPHSAFKLLQHEKNNNLFKLENDKKIFSDMPEIEIQVSTCACTSINCKILETDNEIIHKTVNELTKLIILLL